MSQENDAVQEVKSEVASVSLQARIPPFWRDNPRLWFAQFEAVVSSHRLGDEQKYNLVIPILERSDIEQVSDIILKPPPTGKYEALKSRLISIYQESESRQLQKLLSGLELGDQKPTQLLRKMRDLGGSTFPDDALKVMWMSQIPTQVRAVLSVNTESSLDVLAAMADKMMEHIGYPSIAAVTTATSSTNMRDPHYELLSKQIEKLSLEIAEMRTNNGNTRRFQRSGSRGRFRSRSRTPDGARRKPGDPDWQCRYHFRYGDKARRCESPCAKRKREN